MSIVKKGEPKTLTYLSLVAVVLVLAGLAYAVVHNHMPVKETAWALTPPVIAIALALITKEVYSSLFLGILTGAFLNAGFDLVGTLNQVFQEGLLTVHAAILPRAVYVRLFDGIAEGFRIILLVLLFFLIVKAVRVPTVPA